VGMPSQQRLEQQQWFLKDVRENN